ncbi:hypothetical protein AJ78_07041 [Emergomyces pasteurianus Ep9510]|uniref:Uncharacterized protein n=1 Tax=Emergomyces pasteurianus Ep9510 TaxID=1447872 RepID=A0A1J9Q8T6_9EURO|nr:hypothetical protein AJ78_07041 [Emergomyces pasteurianus Ep9510]
MEIGKNILPAVLHKAESDCQQQQYHHSTPSYTAYRLADIETQFNHSFQCSFPDQFLNLDSNSIVNSNKKWLSDGEELPALAGTTTAATTTTRPSPGRERKQGTLNTAANDPDALAYIIFFNDAHPFWETKREILCKSNLDLLPDSLVAVTNATTTNATNSSSQKTTTATAARRTSYPVFTHQLVVPWQHTPPRLTPPSSSHLLTGYYCILSVRYLEPYRRELAAYLEVKFGTKPRTAEKWVGSFARRWAVITMGLDVAREGRNWSGSVSAAAVKVYLNCKKGKVNGFGRC